MNTCEFCGSYDVHSHLCSKIETLQAQNGKLRAELEGVRQAHNATCRMAGNLEEQNETLLLQNREMALRGQKLEAALDRDKTGLAAALASIREEVKGRRWICDGRGSYQYDDDRYRQETGFAFDAIEKIAVNALAASGKLAHETLAEKPKDAGNPWAPNKDYPEKPISPGGSHAL